MKALSTFLSKMRQNANAGYVLLIEDAIQASSYIPENYLPLFVVSLKNDKPNPSLSFGVFKNATNTYHRINDLIHDLKPLGVDILLNRFSQDFHVLRSDDILLIYKANSLVNSNIPKLFLKICELVNRYSLQAKNIRHDEFQKNLSMLKRAISNDTFFDILNLTIFISELHDVSAYPYHVMSDKTLINISSPRLPDFSYDSISAEVSSMLTDQKKQHLYDCVESGKPITGRQLFSYGNCYYVVFPFNRKFDDSSLITEVIIVVSKRPILHEIIYWISEYIDYFLSYLHLSKRVDMLLSADNQILNLDALPTLKGGDEFLSIYTEFVQTMLDGLVQTTNAFSATMRIFDPFTKALIKIAEAKDDMGQRDVADTSHKEKSIPIRIWRTSVNAFTFRYGGDRFKYVYLPNLDKRLRKNSIPKEYRIAGLQAQNPRLI